MTNSTLTEARSGVFPTDDYLARVESTEATITPSRSGLVRAFGLLALTIGLVALTGAVQSVVLFALTVPLAVLVTADAFAKARTEETAAE